LNSQETLNSPGISSSRGTSSSPGISSNPGTSSSRETLKLREWSVPHHQEEVFTEAVAPHLPGEEAHQAAVFAVVKYYV
jgi:hypothetical protein